MMLLALTGACQGPPQSSLDASPTIPDAGAEPDAGVPMVLACPTSGGIHLDEGQWSLDSDCSFHGDLSLSGSASLRIRTSSLTVQGNLLLTDQAALLVEVQRALFAQRMTRQYRIELRDQSRLEVTGARIDTNDGMPGNLFMSLDAYDDSSVRFRDCSLDEKRNWLLGSFHQRSQLENEGSRMLPTETYPQDASTIRIRGPGARTGLWLFLAPFSSATVEELQETEPMNFSFGRGVAGSEGVEYLVEIVNAAAGIALTSTPHSRLTVRNNHQTIGLGYIFAQTDSPQTLTGLVPGGPQTLVLEHQGRTLTLDQANLGPVGWQIYADNTGVLVPAKITIRDSIINELGAMANGVFEVADTNFQFALIAAVAPGSRIDISRSQINSQTIQASANGVVEIRESQIHGALIEATGQGRVRLINTPLLTNQCHPACLPRCISLSGGTECNGFNPAHDARLVATEQAAILAARIAPQAGPATLRQDLSFEGDALATGVLSSAAGAVYRLGFRDANGSIVTPIKSGTASVRDGQLGVISAADLAPGTWVAVLEVDVPGEPMLLAEQPFTVTP